MVRAISTASLAKLATSTGTEPITIIEIQWSDNAGRLSYADRDIPAAGIPGQIFDISGLDDVLDIEGGATSQQISITLDDTSGTIKALIDANDPHKRPCWVYQWFEGLDISEKFLIFKGVLNTPLEWNEGDRTFKLDVISRIEDVEVGFSVEEGDFISPPDELLGKPWPLCFGTCINVPALQTRSPFTGILAQGTGIHDFTLERRLTTAAALICPENFAGYSAVMEDTTVWGGGPLIITPVYQLDAGCDKSRCEARESLNLQLSEQKKYEISPVIIFNGDTFPQNTTITLNINNGKFTGQFNGNVFTIYGRLHPQNDGSNNVILTQTQVTIQSTCGTNVSTTSQLTQDPNGTPGVTQQLLAAASKASFDYFQSLPTASFFWANAGSTVTLEGAQEIVYIANLLPSTVLRVAAFRDLNGSHQLVTVPAIYYTVRETDYTGDSGLDDLGYNGVTEIVFSQPLSTRDLAIDGSSTGWTDDIYVTLTSTIGPNTVDILEWFINVYTQFTYDTVSFAAVRTKIDNYPMHFPLLVRKPVIQVLQELAYQARCGLWLKDDVFYIKYLAEEPTVDDTITEDDVVANSLVLTHTDTEKLVTKYVASWLDDHSLTTNKDVILRYNVKKYGKHEQTYDYYAYNILDLVRKSATFWLIRNGNTWRQLQFKTVIGKLNLETFDTVNVTLPDLGPGTIKCVVTKANYNSSDNTIDMELWTPLQSGTSTPYNFAWPAQVDEFDFFPTLEEREFGLAGSGTQPNFSTIAPNDHPLSNTNTAGLYKGFKITCNANAVQDNFTGQCRSDHGDPNPSDIGDTKPSPNATSDSSGSISTAPSPIQDSGSAAAQCCSEAKATAAQALSEAQQARTTAQQAADAAGAGASGSGSQDSTKQKLPDDAGKGGNCQAVVILDYITVSSVRKTDQSIGTMDGDTGQIINGQIGSNSESYTFNSAVAAKQFRDAKVKETQDLSDSYGANVGGQYVWVTSTSPPDLGTDTNPKSSNFGQACPEPGSQDQKMIAHSGGPPS